MILKKKVYRGTKLSEGLRYLDNNPPKKISFWITNKEEAESYAILGKVNDKGLHGAIVQGQLEIAKSQIQNLSTEEYTQFQHQSGRGILKNKVGKYDLGVFEIYILPKNIVPKNNEIIKVI